jgi:hypothetical protein
VGKSVNPLLFQAIEAIGQLIGYAFGPRDTIRRITEIDFHREQYMNTHDKREFIAG